MASYTGSGQLDPNAPRPKDVNDTISSTEPTEEENKLAKQVDSLFEKYAKHRRKYDKDWIDNYKMYRGEQWSKKRPSYKHREVINMIFQTIQSQVAVMMDTRPTVGFLPQEPSDLELSEILNQLFESDWEKHNWLDEVLAVVYDAHVYGIGYSEACHDEDYNKGKPGIKFRCYDPLSCYPDPDATNVNKGGDGFITAEPVDLDKLKKKYAGHKYVDQLKPDLEDLSYEKRQLETLHRQKNTDLDLPVDRLSYGSSTEDYSKYKAMVITAYLKPTDTEEITKEELNENGEATGDCIYITRLKYPRGRKVVKINRFIFEDEPLPYEHMEFPFQRVVNYLLAREFYGMSEIDQTKGPQLTFNKLVNFSLDVLTLMGNPVWTVPVEGNVNTRKLTNEPGLIVEYAGGPAMKPQREEGVSLQPYVLQLIDRMEKWFNDQAGTQDVTRGVNPTGVTANAAIENLLEAAQKRIKQKMRNLDSYLKDFGRQWLSLALQYYTAPQVFRLTNKDGSNKYFKFHVEQQPTGETLPDGTPKTKKVAVVRHYTRNDYAQLVPSDVPNEYEIRGEFDVRVNTVSGLPFSKAENEQKILNLFDRQIIDAEEVLRRLEYPNWEAVNTRMKEQQAQAAQAAPQEGA